MLVTAASDDVSSSDAALVNSDGSLALHTGALYGGVPLLHPVGPSGGIHVLGPSQAIISSPGMSTGKKVAIGAGAVLVGAAGVGVYSAITQQSVGFLADTVADRVTSVFARAGEAAREAARVKKRKR